MEALDRLGGETWFRLGDRDLATHLRRTELLHEGLTLTEATRYLCERFGVQHAVVPMSDDPVRTVVETDMGTMSFQEYFVRHRYMPRVQRLRFAGAEQAKPSPAFIDALARADALIVCPSNPLLSIAPILAIPGVRARLAAVPGVRVAVSPIIGGQAVKGPAAKLLEEVTGEPASCVSVARLYGDLCTHVVIDQQDAERRAALEALGYRVTVAQTLMTSEQDKVALARLVGRLCGALP
jgi:LPPG:FO 2-phospho-L-lactate transferase